MDPSWNPAHDLQAQDRAFRIGQRRDVGVYRLVSTGYITYITYTLSLHPHTYACMHGCTCSHACSHEWADGQIYEQPRTLYNKLCTHSNRQMFAGSRQQGLCTAGPIPHCSTVNMHTSHLLPALRTTPAAFVATCLHDHILCGI